MDNTDDKNLPITLAEASEIYGIDNNYLGALARRGRLKARKSGKTWLTTRFAVEEFIRTRIKTGYYREDIQVDDEKD